MVAKKKSDLERELIAQERRDHADRVMAAIGTTDHKAAAYQLADAIGVTYTAARKTIEAGSVLTAKNNSIAARKFGVSTDWLATGEGEMRPTDAGMVLPLVPRRHLTEDEEELLRLVRLVGADGIRNILAFAQGVAASAKASLGKLRRNRV